MLLNFPRHNKMRGMGQIVTWSVRDESLHCEGMIKLCKSLQKAKCMAEKLKSEIIDVAKSRYLRR